MRRLCAAFALLAIAGCTGRDPDGDAAATLAPPPPHPGPSWDLILDLPHEAWRPYVHEVPPVPPLDEILVPAEIERRGTALLDERYDPTRIGKPLSEIDVVFDYDFEQLAAIEAVLEGVDRRTALGQIFDEVTATATNDTERHLALLSFLQRATVHNQWIQPMYPDGTMVTDPLVLLGLNEMRCGHVARVAVDLFQSRGYEGRLVQLGGHVIAEVRYGGRWHYFDADVFGGGRVVRDEDGSIPSVAELSANPSRIDALGSYFESRFDPAGDGRATETSAPYPAHFYFAHSAYVPGTQYTGPYYVRKNATTGQLANRYYGWNYAYAMRATDIALQADLPLHWAPAPVRIRSVQTENGSISISWDDAWDPDGDLTGYRVFVSSASRGWHYGEFGGDPSTSEFGRGGYERTMYDAVFVPPPSDRQSSTTTTTSIVIPSLGDDYVSVMPVDAFGEAVGRTHFFLSDELHVE